MVDPRLVVGAIVESGASKVLNKIECHRLFGSKADTAMIQGIVVEVKRRKAAVTGRTSTTLVIDYDLENGATKRKEVGLRAVKASSIPVPTVEEKAEMLADLEQVADGTAGLVTEMEIDNNNNNDGNNDINNDVLDNINTNSDSTDSEDTIEPNNLFIEDDIPTTAAETATETAAETAAAASEFEPLRGTIYQFPRVYSADYLWELFYPHMLILLRTPALAASEGLSLMGHLGE